MKDFVRHTATAAALVALAVGLVGSSAGAAGAQAADDDVSVATDYKHDVSPALSTLSALGIERQENHANANRRRLTENYVSAVDAIVQAAEAPTNVPSPMQSFDGIPFPGVVCFCAPPDTNGEAGATQYVQIVNEAFQVFDKATGASQLGPLPVSSIWTGFGGVCEFNGGGDPVVVYDQFAHRWIISQFAGSAQPTDECIAVSTSSNAAGTYTRYGFHLGTSFFDYPKLSVWPDAYYMSMNVFNAAGTAYLGPQPFAFDRAAMLAGTTATVVTPGITNGPLEETYLPADLDGATPPPSGTPNPFVEWPSGAPSVYKIYHFHVDWTTPANSTFTLFGTAPAAGFSVLCPATANCVPQLGTTSRLDAIGDRLMFRAAYRNFGTHESLVTNYTVCAGVTPNCTGAGERAGARWIELRSVTSGTPTVHQESTYAPADGVWRWMGSAAMDGSGDLAVGFSASSGAINPQLRYAGRLAGDPLNSLAQGETTLFAGTGSQTGTGNRWGDYSALTIDPMDDCTFWYTNEYYATTGTFNWRTRIGSFKFDECTPTAPPPAPANVHVFKSADTAVVDEGGQIGFTVSLSNDGTVTATGISVTDNLPAGPGIDWSIQGSAPGWSISGSPPNESLVYSPTTLAGLGDTHVHVVSGTTHATCGSQPGTTYTNTASVTSANGGSGSQSASVLVACAPEPVCQVGEGFDDITTLATDGWRMKNQSQPLGTTGWFQGNAATFISHSGAPSSYIAANFNSASGTGTISNWLLTRPLTLQNGARLTFYTRAAAQTFPDRLQVRMSTNGNSTDVGATATSAGDFTTLMLDINPTYTTTGYPQTWTEFTATVSGVPVPTTGRLAFRYFVENGGPTGANSNYIGIDTVSFDCEPSSPPLCAVVSTENFDGVTAPALPAGWTAANAAGPAPLWVTSSSGTPTPSAASAPNAAFVNDPAVVSDKQLESPTIAVPAGLELAKLTFRQRAQLETGFDGGVLELSIDGGAFQDILAAGGNFTAGGYTHTISAGFGNPIGGRQAWSGTIGSTAAGYVTTGVNLPASVVGHDIKLRWRMGSDNAVSGQGWRIDDVSILFCAPQTAAVSIAKTADSVAVPGGSQIGYEVTVSNSGPGQAAGLTVTDALPAGIGVDWTIDAGNTDLGWSVAGSPPNQTLVYAPTLLAGSASTHVHVVSQTTQASCGTFSNTASVSSSNDGGDSATASLQVFCPSAQITDDHGKCGDVLSGPPLDTIEYKEKKGKIDKLDPDKFLYWVKVEASAGSNTFTINQSITTGNFAELFKLADAKVMKGDCKGGPKAKVTQDTTAGTSSTMTVTFTAPAAGTYYLQLKLEQGRIKGQPVPTPSTVHYELSTVGVLGSSAGIDLVED